MALALWEVFWLSWIQLSENFSTTPIFLQEKAPVYLKGNLQQKCVGGSRVEEIGKRKKKKKHKQEKKSLFFCWEGGISAEDSPGPYTQHTPLQQPPAPLPAASAGISSLRWSPQIRIQISLGFFFLRLEKQAMPLLDYSSAVLMS